MDGIERSLLLTTIACILLQLNTKAQRRRVRISVKFGGSFKEHLTAYAHIRHKTSPTSYSFTMRSYLPLIALFAVLGAAAGFFKQAVPHQETAVPKAATSASNTLSASFDEGLGKQMFFGACVGHINHHVSLIPLLFLYYESRQPRCCC